MSTEEVAETTTPEVKPEAEEQTGATDKQEAPQNERKISRQERKMRDLIMKSGAKKFEDEVLSCKICGPGQFEAIIAKPDVYYVNNVYVIFGETSRDSGARNIASDIKETAEALKTTKAEIADDEAVDEEGLNPDEIDMVMEQASCTRSQAVKALRKSGDVVTAVMELS